MTTVTILAYRFRLVIQANGRGGGGGRRGGPEVTRQFCARSFEDFFYTIFGHSIQKDSLFVERGIHKAFFRQSVSAHSKQKRMIVLVDQNETRG